MTSITTRRALLKAAPLATAAFAVPAIAATTTRADRTAWSAAFASYQSVMAENAVFSPRHADLWQKCKSACERVPHVTFRPDPYSGATQPVTTADDWFVRSARLAVVEVDNGKRHLDPIPALQKHFTLQREVAQAADERDAAIQCIRDSFGMDAADQESDDLGDRLCEVSQALMNVPAPDLAGLRLKLDHLLVEEGSDSTPCWSMDFARQTIADIARLLPEAG